MKPLADKIKTDVTNELLSRNPMIGLGKRQGINQVKSPRDNSKPATSHARSSYVNVHDR